MMGLPSGSHRDRRHQRFLNEGLRRSASTRRDPTAALTLNTLNLTTNTKTGDHFDDPEIMDSDPTKQLAYPRLQGFRHPIAAVRARYRHDKTSS